MDHQPSGLVKAPANEPHDLLARLYREVGISAVAAALAPAASTLAPAPAGSVCIAAPVGRAAA